MKHSYCGFEGYFFMPAQLYFHYPFKDKFCKRCGQTKPIEMFGRDNKKTEYGIRRLYKWLCKSCISEYNKSKKVYKPKRIPLTDEEKKERSLSWSKKHRDNLSLEKRERRLQQGRDWYHNNREKSIINAKKWKDENKERLNETRGKYTERNKDRINKVNRIYVNNRLKEDILYKLKYSLRRQIRTFIKGKGMSKGGNTTEIILGTSYSLVKLHIESQFKDGMTWDNHGISNNQWHIDHIIPLSSAKTEVELLPLFHYSNLQPLWGLDNRVKSAKMPNV